jgi:Xaa-Pro aminopeptidase
MGTATHAIVSRLQRLRDALRAAGLDAVLVPSSDPHVSENVPAHWQGRRWLSGFTGSTGTLVVTLDGAALVADNHYWVQAEAQLAGTGIDVVKASAGATLGVADWLPSVLQPGAVVAVDGDVLGLELAAALRASLGDAGIHWRSDVDLLDTVWGERPALPTQALFEHLPPHATVTRSEKLAAVRAAMRRQGASHHFISSLDDIAWLSNLRGSDIECTPVFLSHLLLSHETCLLFVDERKLDTELRQRLLADGIATRPYEQASAALADMPGRSVVLVDPRRVTLGFRQSIPEHCTVLEAINPSVFLKSRKSEAEAAQLRETMAEDGAAMCEFYAWFEHALGREPISELTIDERLSAERARRPGFVSLSFPTIAAFNGHGAMPHYTAKPEACAMIEGDGLLLIDSGGQYLGGTTDITRTWAIGRVSEAMKRDFTLVLRGAIALMRTTFPRGTLSPMLDSIARTALWAQGINYAHGTGHGVGYFLSVHEGPQTFRQAVAHPSMAMEPGMVTSIEPAVYRPGQWGVRIEHLVLNVPVATPEAGAFGDFLAFEPLTLCPIDTRCIERTLMRDDEVAWLNAYHARVRQQLESRLSAAGRSWLIMRTEPL